MTSDPRFDPQRLQAFATRCFMACGMEESPAALVAANLVLADLRGIASHGVTRIPIYGQRLLQRTINPSASPVIESDAGALLLVDGDNGAGAVVSDFANRLAIRRARELGACVVSVHGSNHHGICSAYTMESAAHGLIGIVATNAARSMAVAGGREPIVGTNPISFAFPRPGQPPLVLDMATSVVARGRIVEMAKRGEPIPDGWALDSEGRATTDAGAAEQGVVLPVAGAKGSGLAVMIELLCSALSGGTPGPLIPNLYKDLDRPQGIGHVFIAIDPARVGRSNFGEMAASLAALLKASACASGIEEILMPGEPEARIEAERRAHGVPLPDNVLRELDEWAAQHDVAPLGGRVSEGA